MDISHEEAQESLDLVEDDRGRTPKAVASGRVSVLLILFGAICGIACLIAQFLPRDNTVRLWWLAVFAAAIAACWLFALFRKDPLRSPVDKRLWLFWLFLYVYAHMWIIMMFLNVKKGTVTGEQMAVFASTVPVFAYVVMGLWTRDRLFVWLGLLVTAATLAGLFLGTSILHAMDGCDPGRRVDRLRALYPL